MNHIKSFSTLNRTKAHRKALYKNMTTSLLRYGKIETTFVVGVPNCTPAPAAEMVIVTSLPAPEYAAV